MLTKGMLMDVSAVSAPISLSMAGGRVLGT